MQPLQRAARAAVRQLRGVGTVAKEEVFAGGVPRRRRSLAKVARLSRKGLRRETVDEALRPARELRDPLNMAAVMRAEGDEVADPSGRGVFVKPAKQPTAAQRLDELLDAEGAGALECLERLRGEGVALGDADVARLVSHCIREPLRNHGVLTVAMFDAVAAEAEQVLAAAERLGHAAGEEAHAVFVCLQANPTQGVARDLPRSLELLEEFPSRFGVPHAPGWVYDQVLLACALEDDDESARRLVAGGAPLSPVGWVYALSACNRYADAAELREQMLERGVEETLDHRTALVKAATKGGEFSKGEEVFRELERLAEEGGEEGERLVLTPDAFLTAMALRAAAGRAGDARLTFLQMTLRLRNKDLDPGLLKSVLSLCQTHVEGAQKDYRDVARRVLAIAEQLGYLGDSQLLTRAARFFASIGDEETVTWLRGQALHKGPQLEGYFDDFLQQSRARGGFVEAYRFGPLNAMIERRQTFTLRRTNDRDMIVTAPKVLPHGEPFRGLGTVGPKPMELVTPYTPSTPKM